jgi:two-component system, OmpR family, KDP operon response regulator KdpE
VVDDEQQIGRVIRSALERQGDEVILTYTGQDGVELTATCQPDVLVLDLHLPDLNGTEVVRRVRPWFTNPILVLSGASDERSRVAALDAGADDFLTKPFGLAELQARLRALQRRVGTAAAEPAPTRVGYRDLVVDLASRSLTVAGREVLLTPTEWRLLVAFATNPGVLLSHHQLLAEGWSQGYGDESRQALRAHIRSLRSKIGDPASAPLYIRTESGIGYRWVAAGDASPPHPTDGGQTPDAVHDLSNVTTAMRLAVDLAELGGDDPAAAAALVTRMSDLVNRAVTLIAELERNREAYR